MASVPAVGIDLGTTYSSIAWLNEQSEPVTIPNLEGDSSTPSVVMYLEGREVVGEEALHNAIEHPERVIQGAKRFLADPRKSWTIDGKTITPVDVSTAIVRKLLGDARAQIGPVHRAVITVPAQFSERQRLATIEAGQRAGLRQVDLINEPVAAALCYVLGAEGLWFSQLAEDQRILVYDLGGGTFDLSLVSYQQDRVQVLASTGDLHLGGMDWNQRLLSTIAEQFQREMQEDPRTNVRSLQRLHREVERCKRELSRQTRSTLVVEHAGHRKSYQIERSQFDQLTADLLERTRQITQGLINQHRAGSSHLDVTIVSTGGSSRMPMIDTMLKSIRGTTHSKALSPDQSIAHGAAYFAGMLLSNSPDVGRFAGSSTGQRLARFTQSSVNARSLGLLIRDVDSGERVPFYLIPQNTPLPATAAKTFGTVHPDQRRVTLSIVESGANPDDPHSAIGVCSIDELPPGLPAESPIEVSISYDGSARVSVAARELTSGKAVRVELTRETPGATPAAPEEDVGTPTGQPTPTASMATRAPAPPPRTVTSPGPTPTPTVAPPRELLDLVESRALKRGTFRLASGREASFYLDVKQVVLEARGAMLVGRALLERLRAAGPLPVAVGGLAIGADPVTGAIVTMAGVEGVALKGFMVRKEPKGHGLQRFIEGPVEPGQRVVIVEDVVTTGGSSLLAIDRAVEFGLVVERLVTVIDRLAGGREALAARGIPLESLVTIRDLGIDPDAG